MLGMPVVVLVDLGAPHGVLPTYVYLSLLLHLSPRQGGSTATGWFTSGKYLKSLPQTAKRSKQGRLQAASNPTQGSVLSQPVGPSIAHLSFLFQPNLLRKVPTWHTPCHQHLYTPTLPPGAHSRWNHKHPPWVPGDDHIPSTSPRADACTGLALDPAAQCHGHSTLVGAKQTNEQIPRCRTEANALSGLRVGVRCGAVTIFRLTWSSKPC